MPSPDPAADRLGVLAGATFMVGSAALPAIGALNLLGGLLVLSGGAFALEARTRAGAPPPTLRDGLRLGGGAGLLAGGAASLALALGVACAGPGLRDALVAAGFPVPASNDLLPALGTTALLLTLTAATLGACGGWIAAHARPTEGPPCAP